MSFMDKLTSTMEKYLLPIAGKVSSQRHLVALRDGFIATLTASMAGSFAVMINCVFFQNDSLIGKPLNTIGFWKDSVQPILDKWIMNIGWQVQGATLKIICILLIIGLTYSLSKSYECDPLSAVIISLASYFALLPQNVQTGFTFDEEKAEYIKGVSNVLNVDLFGSTSMFAAIIVAFVATELFVRMTKRGWVIKMPEQVPPAVSKSFAALIPGIVTISFFALIGVIFNVAIEKSLPVWISELIQKPLMSLGQSPATFIFLAFLTQLLWFFGLHGMTIVNSVLDPMYSPALLANTDAVAAGKKPEYALVRNFLDVYAMPGGSGGTLALLIALALFSKRQESKELMKLAMAPALFQINEPVIFGLPLILNVTYLIPFVFCEPLMLFIAWIFTAVIPFADYVVFSVPWTCPPIVSAFIATNGDYKAAILAAVLLVLSVIIWSPFVIAANKMGSGEEA